VTHSVLCGIAFAFNLQWRLWLWKLVPNPEKLEISKLVWTQSLILFEFTRTIIWVIDIPPTCFVSNSGTCIRRVTPITFTWCAIKALFVPRAWIKTVLWISHPGLARVTLCVIHALVIDIAPYTCIWSAVVTCFKLRTKIHRSSSSDVPNVWGARLVIFITIHKLEIGQRTSISWAQNYKCRTWPWRRWPWWRYRITTIIIEHQCTTVNPILSKSSQTCCTRIRRTDIPHLTNTATSRSSTLLSSTRSCTTTGESSAELKSYLVCTAVVESKCWRAEARWEHWRALCCTKTN